jgi:protein-disulfide isomerase
MPTTYKATAISADLADRIKVRPGLKALALVQSFSAGGDPLINLGTGVATTNRAAIVKTQAQPWTLAQDILGNAALQYTPHVIKLLWEASPAGGFTAEDRAQLQMQASAMGCQIKLYQTASGSGVVLADIDNEAKLVATFDPDAYRPLISSQ